MQKMRVVCFALLLAGAAALPGWRRDAEEAHPDRDVERVEPVNTGDARRDGPGASDESPQIIPFGIALRGIGHPVLAIRPLGPRDSADEDSAEDIPGGGAGGGFFHPYFVDPMSSFMAQMADMMAAMRRQMNQVLHRLPSEGTDLSKLGNTTSTTKVVDGHIITVNETLIGGEEGDDSVVHVRVIDVRPSESPDNADDKKDVEPLDNEVTRGPSRTENEIPMKVGSEVDDLNA